MSEDSCTFYRGRRVAVRALRRPDGTCPAKEFYDALSDSDQAKFQATFEYLGDNGAVTNQERMRQLNDISSGKVFEFKVHSDEGKRIWGMFIGQGEMLLSHGGPKPGDRRLRQEVERAEAFIDEWKRNR